MLEPVPIGLVAHYAFCPRRAWLESTGEQTDTRQVAIGVRAHAAADDPGRSRPTNVRALDVFSDDWGLVGRCDSVRTTSDGSLQVIEHKATPVRKKPVVTDPMRIQLALQRHALQQMGHAVSSTRVWFSTHGVEVPVELTPDDDLEARRLVELTRALIGQETAPTPLEDDPRCNSCSHISVCLPDERLLGTTPKRIHASDPDSQVVHLATFGARLHSAWAHASSSPGGRDRFCSRGANHGDRRAWKR